MSQKLVKLKKESWIQMVGPNKNVPMLMLMPTQLDTKEFEDGDVVDVEITIRPTQAKSKRAA